MLVLSRKPQEAIEIEGGITVRVLEVRGGQGVHRNRRAIDNPSPSEGSRGRHQGYAGTLRADALPLAGLSRSQNWSWFSHERRADGLLATNDEGRRWKLRFDASRRSLVPTDRH